METTQDRTVTLTENALIAISDMRDKCSTIEAWYGNDHPKSIAAVRSLAYSLTHMIRLGGVIHKDGDLSLFGSSFIHYGIVWFGDKNAGVHADTGEDLIGAPETGTWSVHS